MDALYTARLRPATADAAAQAARTTAATPSVLAGNPPAAAASTAKLSSFARQLSDAAAHAALRDNGASREQLAALAGTITDALLGARYDQDKAAHDAEVPDSSDPARLALAGQATRFVNDEGPNPFKSLPRDQLALIAYDESGTFTVNEQRAAWLESYDQEQAWKRAAIARMDEEHERLGKVSERTQQSIRDHYASLPAIEAARYAE